MLKNIQIGLRSLIVLGLFLFPFIPLFVASSLFFPYITGKAFAFRIIVEIIVAAWLLLAALDREQLPRRSPILWAVLGLVAISSLAAIFGANPYRSFWSNFERMEGLITYLHLLGYFLVLISVLKSEKLWGWFLNLSLAVSVIVGSLALNQWLAKAGAGGFRADATFGNPIYLAVYALVHFFLALFVLVRSSGRWPRIIYGALALFEIGVIYLTATRSAMLGLVGGVLLATILVALFEREHRGLRRWAIGFSLAVLLVVGGFWLAKDSAVIQNNPVLSRLANISLRDNTTRHRLIVWGMGWQGVKERPLLGWGAENFNLVFNRYYDPALYGAESWFDRSHNILIDWLAHAGLLGLLAYLGLFAAALRALWRQRSWSLLEKSILVGLFTAYFIHNLFVFDNLISYLLFFALLAYLHVSSTDQTVEKRKFTPSSVWLWLSLPLAGALIFSIYFFNWRVIVSGQELVQAISFYPEQLPSAGMLDEYVKQKEELFKKVFAADTMAGGEASEQLLNLTLRLIQNKEVSQERKQEFVTLTNEQMLAQIKRAPADARAQLFYGTFLVNLGYVQEGVKHLEIAQSLSPNKQQILFELTSAYWRLGDKKKARELAQKTYDLNPEVAEAKSILEQVSK